MLPRADSIGTRPVAAIEALTPVVPGINAKQETLNRLTQIAIGQEVQAKIISLFNDGSYLVHVSDVPARMMLPAGTSVGDSIPMTLISHEPRTTFLLEPENQAQWSATPTQLSSTGKLIDRIIQFSAQNGESVTVGKVPVLEHPPSSHTEQTANALLKTITYSGLFYESHLAEWAKGDRPLPELQQEPQIKSGYVPLQAETPINKGSESIPPTQRIMVQAYAIAEKTPHLEKTPIAENLPASEKPETVTSSFMTNKLELDSASPSSLHTQTAQQISQQLNVLEQQRIIWHGELYPGQPMEWEINKEHVPQTLEEQQHAWYSTVRFELPNLGPISATLCLIGDHIQVNIRAIKDTTAEILPHYQTELANAIALSGAKLDFFSVKQDESI